MTITLYTQSAFLMLAGCGLFLGLSLLSPVASAADDLKLQRLDATSKSRANDLIDSLWARVDAHAQKNSVIAPGYPYEAYTETDDWGYSNHFRDFGAGKNAPASAQALYEVNFSGMRVLAGVASFVPMIKIEPHCSTADVHGERHCQQMAGRHQVCHLFLFDPKTHAIRAVGAMPIERDNRPLPGGASRNWWNHDPKRPNDPRQIEGWARCDGVRAVALAKVVPNALLITLSYIDSAAPISKHEDEYPPQFTTTSLLRFSRDAQGQVVMTQDQSCLGNPNTITTIADARKRLQACVAKAPFRAGEREP